MVSKKPVHKAPRLNRQKAKDSSGLRAFAGIWKDLDTDKMIEEIYRLRHEAPEHKPIRL